MARLSDLKALDDDTLHVFELTEREGAVQHDAAQLLKQVQKVPGVRRAEFNTQRKRLILLGTFDQEDVARVVGESGFDVLTDKGREEAPKRTGPSLGERTRALVSHRLFLTLVVLLPVSFLVGIGLSILAIVPSPRLELVGGLAVALLGVGVLMALPSLGRNAEHAGFGFLRTDTGVVTLIVLVALGIRGAWTQALLVLAASVVMQLAPWYASERLRRRFVAVKERLPRSVRLLDDASQSIVPVEEVQPGQVLRIEAGEVVPLDGRVVQGEGTIDASAVTGEGIPFVPAEGARVFAGCTLVEGSLDVRVERRYDKGWLHSLRPDNLWKLLQTEASLGWLRWIERIPVIFVYLATLIMVVPPLLFGAAIEPWLNRALALLVVAPVNTLIVGFVAPNLAARVKAAEFGAMLGSPSLLHDLGGAKRLVITPGTLLDPRHTLVGIETWEVCTAEEALQLAASVASQSEHPVALAILEAAQGEGVRVTVPIQVDELQGKGIRAVLNVGGSLNEFLLGTGAWMKEAEVECPDQAAEWVEMASREGGVLYWLAHEGRAVAAFVVQQRVRDGSRRLLSRIRRTGVSRVSMLWDGERAPLARWADEVGADTATAELSVEDADQLIRGWQASGESVAGAVGCFDQEAALGAADVRIRFAGGGWVEPTERCLILASQDPFLLYPLLDLAKRVRRISRYAIALAAIAKCGITLWALMGGTPWAYLAWVDAVALLLIMARSARVARRG